MNERAIISLAAASNSDIYFNVAGFANMMEEKFEELYNSYPEAAG